VETSLIRTGFYALAWDGSIHLRYGEAITAQPSSQRPSAVSGYFRTKDERWICVVPRGLACVPRLMKGLGLEGLFDPAGLDPMDPDYDFIRQARAEVDAAYAKLTLEEAGAMLTEADVIWAPMATLDDVAIDPQMRAAGCFVVTPDRFGGAFEAPATPVRFPGLEIGPRGPAPALGEHTRDVLAEIGADPKTVWRQSAEVE
jgi:crotonobetainyl-CoA:carnitine CoA-transferase CaiB-like acyl-CoA transferase